MNAIFLQAAAGGYSSVFIGAIIILLLSLTVYMVPTIIARGKKRFLPIAALNLLLGWTLLGWVGALVWALYKETD